MASKRKKKRSGRYDDFGLSDEVKQSIIAVSLVTAGFLFLLSFLGLAGSIGNLVDAGFSAVFGSSRWVFAVILFAFGWRAIVSEDYIPTRLQFFGAAVFFIAFDGLLNLVLVDDPANTEMIKDAGGYIGLLISHPLTSLVGYWGALVLVVAGLLTGFLLMFNSSLYDMFIAPLRFDWLKVSRPRRERMERVKDDDDEEEVFDDDFNDEEEEDLAQEIDVEEDEEEEEDDEEEEIVMPGGALLARGSGATDAETVMTSRRRRRIKVPVDLLDDVSSHAEAGDTDRNQEIIRRTFENFNVDVDMVGVRVGPTVTQYSLRPAQGVKLSRIVALQNDLALALAAHPIRIEAPIPGKSLVGVEVPNQSVGMVCLRELLQSKNFKKRKSSLAVPLGKDVTGAVQMVSVDKAPHMLVAGATGSGKSVCLNDIIISLLYQNGPDDLKFIMVDPKRVELGVYAGIPHLLVPPITKAEEAINALKWGVREMERRLDHLAKFGARDIDSYNKKSQERMPKIVIVIDELSDLMSQSKRDVEALIVRIAQMARAAGIHLILATQRPSVDVITGIIKANIPTRIAFAVASQVDSKTILDVSGAEKLLGRGDMLYSDPQTSKPRRSQGAYVSDDEIQRVIQFLKEQGEPDYNYQVTEEARTGGAAFSSDDSDPLFNDAAQIVVEAGKASTSFLQRRMRVGYSRAARIMDLLQEAGIVGEQNGSKAREILVDSWPRTGVQTRMETVVEEAPSEEEVEDDVEIDDDTDMHTDESHELIEEEEIDDTDGQDEDLDDETDDWDDEENDMYS